MKSDRARWAAAIVVILIALAWVALAVPSLWSECRADGHSRFYCARVAMR